MNETLKLLMSVDGANADLAQPVASDISPAAPVDDGLRLPDDALILIPMRNLVLFPGLAVPLAIGRESSVAAAQFAARAERKVGILLQRDAKSDNPTQADMHEVGTEATILRYLTTPDGGHHVVCRGERRFRVVEFVDGFPFLVARVTWLEAEQGGEATFAATPQPPEIEARMIQLKERVAEILQLLPQAPAELATTAQAMTDPAQLADFVAGLMDLEPAVKQELLETVALQPRLDLVLEHLARRIEVMRLSAEIGQQTGQRINERQREMLLREQLQTIQQALGDDSGNANEIDELRKTIEKARMPEAIEAHALKELKRLARMPEAAGEHSSLRTYIDWLIELPWPAREQASPANGPESSLASIDIGAARRILDEDHFGLDKIKRRILEYLAVRKLNPRGKSPILCFVGPPGVGKTSLGQSIAKATGRAFARISLGGVHDEAEIRGHRRTYVGALPGNILQALRKAGTTNSLLLLDEIDKIGSGVHGDPSAALLEVLDPEQNNAFRDNYLGMPYDLSGVMFIATANQLDTIQGPLRDRMEIIQLPGYTLEEKTQIASRYLVPRQREANGLAEAPVSISEEAIQAVISDYTREAGVRNLERELGSLFRHVAMRVAEGEKAPIAIDAGALAPILGPIRHERDVAMRTGVSGVATGLAWTPVGGDILFIEASTAPGSGRLILTGQLGDVMKESAQAALTLIKTRATSIGIDAKTFARRDIHVHVPAGAIPKDGPSAGVAMFVALSSMALDKPVRSDLAMTGEISLRGLVLPVGGIREKVLAALRAGIRTVMLPARNRRDLDDIPASAREQLEIIWLETVDDALRVALGTTPVPADSLA